MEMNPMDMINQTQNEKKGNQVSPDKENNQMLDKDGFMKMFLASLKHQDPMSPMETNDMMAQMAQLSMVEAVTNLQTLVKDLGKTMSMDKNVTDYSKMVGKTGSGYDNNGKFIQGNIDEVQKVGDGIKAIIDGKSLSVENVTSIKNYIKNS